MNLVVITGELADDARKRVCDERRVKFFSKFSVKT